MASRGAGYMGKAVNPIIEHISLILSLTNPLTLGASRANRCAMILALSQYMVSIDTEKRHRRPKTTCAAKHSFILLRLWKTDVKGLTFLQRIIQYDFGRLKFLVRSESDVYLKQVAYPALVLSPRTLLRTFHYRRKIFCYSSIP